jgi:HEAT repeat protein
MKRRNRITETPTPLSIRETIAGLSSSGKPLLSSRLADLSDLGSEELRFLERVWVDIEPGRRRQIVYRLVELAEDNFKLDFNSIFWNCLKDQDAEVRCKAIDGLWENEETSLIDPLINLLKQDNSEKVQAAAAAALGGFAMLAEHKKLRSCHVSEVCRALLATIGDNSKSIDVKRRALEAAASLNLPQVKKAIMEAYRSNNAKLRTSAIYAMGKNCDAYWLPILLKALASADTKIRYEAAGSCGELEEEEAIPYLVELINDPDIDVQLATIQAMGKIGGTEAKEHLEQCLSNPNGIISRMAEQALQELRTNEEPFSFPV